MFIRLLKIVGPVILLVVLWMISSEFKLHGLVSKCTSFELLNLVQHTEPQLAEKVVDLKLIPGTTVEAHVSWSAGNKTYYYCKLTRAGDTILDFWGTNSFLRSPRMWLERERGDRASRILTYQPAVFPQETAGGTVQDGYLLWTFDGSHYQPSAFKVCPLNLFLRNPLPFQD